MNAKNAKAAKMRPQWCAAVLAAFALFVDGRAAPRSHLRDDESKER
jgi:hypothetical protein